MRGHRERQSGEGVDGHGRHDEDESQSAVDRGAAFEAEGDAEEQVTDDQEADLFEVMDPLVFHHEVEQSGQVRDRDEDEVRGETEEWLGDQRHETTVEEVAQALGAGVVGEVEWRAEGEEGSGHHDQQEVLDHVVAEVLHVEHPDDGLRRDERHDQPREEGNRSLSGPKADALGSDHVEHQRREHHQQRQDTQVPLVPVVP